MILLKVHIFHGASYLVNSFNKQSIELMSLRALTICISTDNIDFILSDGDNDKYHSPKCGVCFVFARVLAIIVNRENGIN